MGACRKRLKRGEVDRYLLIVGRVRIGSDGGEVLFSALRLKECASHIVRGEDGARCTKLSAHIRNGCALRHGKSLNTLAAVLNDSANAALNAKYTKYLKNDVLCTNVVGKLTLKINVNNSRHGDVVCAAAHCDRYVKTAGAHTKHTDTSRGGSMAIRSDKRLSGLAESFKMNLMADAVAGTGEANSVLLGYRLNVSVVVCILKAGLKSVVVDVSYRKLGLDPLRSHSLKLKVSHSSGRILRQGLIYSKADLCAGYHLALKKMRLYNFLCNSVSHFAFFLYVCVI